MFFCSSYHPTRENIFSYHSSSPLNTICMPFYFILLLRFHRVHWANFEREDYKNIKELVYAVNQRGGANWRVLLSVSCQAKSSTVSDKEARYEPYTVLVVCKVSIQNRQIKVSGSILKFINYS